MSGDNPLMSGESRQGGGGEAREAAGDAGRDATGKERQVRPPEELRRLQEHFGAAAREPLSFAAGRMECRRENYEDAVMESIRPRGSQGPAERLAIYNEQYWYRLLTVLQEDFPLLCRTLGYWEFNQLAAGFLDSRPSRTPFLENIAWRLPEYLSSRPRFAAPRNLRIAAVDMAGFRAFHAPSLPPLDPAALTPEGVEALAAKPLGFQPWFTALEEDWNLVESRQAVLEGLPEVPSPREEKAYWAVHRRLGAVEWTRLEPVWYRLIRALQDGAPLDAACDAVAAGLAGDEADAFVAGLGPRFAEWTGLGWFVREPIEPPASPAA